jgi:hypothetical protein
MARRKPGHATGGSPDWERVATFLVGFEQRAVGNRLDQRIVAEQTGPEPGPPVTRWSSWESGPLCDWMRERVAPGSELAPEKPPEEPPAEPVTRGAGMGQLSIQQVTLVDASVRVEVVAEGVPSAQPLESTRSGRLEVSVTGAPADREVWIALRFRRAGGPRWSPQEPVLMPAEGPAQIELSDVAPGTHLARLVAWTPDASADPAVLELGPLTIQ